ncbi:MAG: ABC transporter permease [Desulfitobacteriaceae bacterium]|nr:ABC transporter permease [Desulfitobacteriaceae bacterium]MDD4346164.1 ABC transporter permease [Desulfitobacteriaceae bacterium]MDD4400867.1 ABC transporter permease [Desulfitobacteriaceae bacterium]
MGFSSILWQEAIFFKRKFWSITTGSIIAPVLYLIAFGWGLGGGMRIDGTDYINFVIPGIVALTTMTVSFSTIANSINISRMYEKTFEEFMVAPLNMWVYAAGKITAGSFRGLYSGFLILFLAFLFQTGIKINPYFLFILILNCLTFSAIGFIIGIIIKSHADMGKFTSFIITPMAFLCGTFFPLEKMPFILKNIIWLLPLTHTSLGLRSSGEDFYSMLIHPGILLLYFIVASAAGVRLCKKAE